MLALQYSIHLAHDADDKIIEDRVNSRAPVFEDLNGLVHKAFLYNREDKLYAPFYVWQGLTGAKDFLFDELFRGLVSEFHRPRTRSWIVLNQGNGGLKTQPPSFARCESDLMTAEDRLEDIIERENNYHENVIGNPNLYYNVIAINPDRWEIMRYSLWKDESSAPEPESDCVQGFEVLHINEPNHCKEQAA